MKTYTIYDKDGEWIKIRRIAQGQYEVIDDSVTDKEGSWLSDQVELTIFSLDPCVVDLYEDDIEMCDTCLRYEDMEIGTHIIQAPSVEKIKDVFWRYIHIGSRCPGDI